MKTKDYKRAVKRLKTGERPHDERDAEAAAGMGTPKND
jgi:bud site selection protein 20